MAQKGNRDSPLSLPSSLTATDYDGIQTFVELYRDQGGSRRVNAARDPNTPYLLDMRQTQTRDKSGLVSRKLVKLVETFLDATTGQPVQLVTNFTQQVPLGHGITVVKGANHSILMLNILETAYHADATGRFQGYWRGEM